MSRPTNALAVVSALAVMEFAGLRVAYAGPDLIVEWCKARNFPNLVAMCVAEMRAQGPGLLRNLERQHEMEEMRASAQRKAKVEFRRLFDEDVDLGYAHMTLQELVEQNPPPETKVAVAAHVVNPSTIVDNRSQRPGVFDVKFQASIVLGSAPAVVRDKVIACIHRLGADTWPCPMMLRGYVDRCTINYYGVEKAIPCLTIEDAWELQGLLNNSEAAEMKLGPMRPY